MANITNRLPFELGLPDSSGDHKTLEVVFVCVARGSYNTQEEVFAESSLLCVEPS